MSDHEHDPEPAHDERDHAPGEEYDHDHEPGHEHRQDHGHDHDHGGLGHHHDVSQVSDGRLLASIVLNLGLTVVEVVVGVFAGSLSLIADAVHNFNDSAALLIAYIARRIARRGADANYTFGYRRAELIGAMINLTTLVVVGLYLIYESIHRLLDPQPVLGQWVMVAAGVALIVDVFTAAFLWKMSQGNLNIRAAFIHNLSDAAASLAVLLGGLAIWQGLPSWIDPLLTLLLALYILATCVSMLRRTASILMENTPPGLDLDEVHDAMEAVEGVQGVHHLHIWELDEQHRALEAHVELEHDLLLSESASLRATLHKMLLERFSIQHTTLELECPDQDCKDAGTLDGCYNREASQDVPASVGP